MMAAVAVSSKYSGFRFAKEHETGSISCSFSISACSNLVQIKYI